MITLQSSFSQADDSLSGWKRQAEEEPADAPPAKVPATAPRNIDEVREAIQNNRGATLKMVEIKVFLETHGLPSDGQKAQLLERATQAVNEGM